MRKTLVVGTISVMLAAVAGLGAAYASQDGETIRLRGKDTAFHELDLGDEGPSVGDQSIFTGDLFDRSGHKAGHYAGQSVAMTPIAFDPKPSGEMLSRAAYVLERGQILNAGLVQAADLSPGKEFSLAVIGGTGAYRDAAGEMIIKDLPEGFEVTIHLE